MPRFFSKRLGGKFIISPYITIKMDKRQAKKYHAKLFKNKSDLASGKTIGLYQQDLKNLVAIRKSKGLSYADAESGSAKYFSDIKMIAPEDGEADPLKNQIQMKSRKYFKADGGKTKEHPDNRVSRKKDPKRFEGTDLEYLSIAEKGGHQGKARYGGEKKVKRKHAPKFRGTFTHYEDMVEQAPSLPSQLLAGFEETQERQFLQKNVEGFKTVRDTMDIEKARQISSYVGDRQSVKEDKRFTRHGLGHTGFEIGKFVGGERQEMNRRFTEETYFKNIYSNPKPYSKTYGASALSKNPDKMYQVAGGGLRRKGIAQPSYHPTQKEADHKSSSLRATYPDQYKTFKGQGVSQLPNIKPGQRHLEGESMRKAIGTDFHKEGSFKYDFEHGRAPTSVSYPMAFGKRGIKGYTPQPQLGTIPETRKRKLIIKKKGELKSEFSKLKKKQEMEKEKKERIAERERKYAKPKPKKKKKLIIKRKKKP